MIPVKPGAHRKLMAKSGGYREGAGRCKHFNYKNNHIQGTWELKLVQFLDEKKVEWQRNKVGYKYLFENKERQYYPDFFLPKYNLYVEVKGYESDKDKSKWNQFPFKLLIVKRKEIFSLEEWFTTNFDCGDKPRDATEAHNL